jgi:hypothetical protein
MQCNKEFDSYYLQFTCLSSLMFELIRTLWLRHTLLGVATISYGISRSTKYNEIAYSTNRRLPNTLILAATTNYLSSKTTMTPPSSSTETSTSLLLFALSAKLWIDHHFRTHAHNCCCNQNRESTRLSEESTNNNDYEGPFETESERRARRNLRLSIDSPSFSEHHFHRGEEVERKKMDRIDSNDDSEQDGEPRLTNSINFLNDEGPQWRELMDRISIADSVLTRVS